MGVVERSHGSGQFVSGAQASKAKTHAFPFYGVKRAKATAPGLLKSSVSN